MIQIANSPTPGATLDTPIEHLSACHRRIEERLRTLERAVPELRSRTVEALAAIQAVFWFFDSSGVHHTADEEESFFPRIADRTSNEEREYLNRLESEHAQVESLYVQCKDRITRLDGPPSVADEAEIAACAREFCARYRAHIASEETSFPAIAARALTADDLIAISKEMKQRRGI